MEWACRPRWGAKLTMMRAEGSTRRGCWLVVYAEEIGGFERLEA